MSDNTERQWHTLTVRFGTDGPLDVSEIPSRTNPPQVAMGEALRKILGTEQTLLLDDIQLHRADVKR